jgi:hypothetical protein
LTSEGPAFFFKTYRIDQQDGARHCDREAPAVAALDGSLHACLKNFRVRQQVALRLTRTVRPGRSTPISWQRRLISTLIQERPDMTNIKSKLFLAALLLAAGAAQAAAPSSAIEIPAAWYADQIVVADAARGATQPVFPGAAYEHGPIGVQYAEPARLRSSIAGGTTPYPSSPNESGSVL